jgi:hypothetical protein
MTWTFLTTAKHSTKNSTMNVPAGNSRGRSMSRIIHVGVRLSKFVYVLYGDDSEPTRLTSQKIRNPAEDSSLPRAGDEILTSAIIFLVGNIMAP